MMRAAGCGCSRVVWAPVLVVAACAAGGGYVWLEGGSGGYPVYVSDGLLGF